MINTVCVWLDEASGETPAWIVSVDALDADGGAETTRTVSTHEDRDEAIAAGEQVAAAKGLPLKVAVAR